MNEQLSSPLFLILSKILLDNLFILCYLYSVKRSTLQTLNLLKGGENGKRRNNKNDQLFVEDKRLE